MLDKLVRVALHPGSLRLMAARKLIARLPLSYRRALSYKTLVDASIVDRPQYGYCMYNAARLAVWLGHKTVSAIEFGVAGGNGLISAERHAQEISRELGVEFQIYGFDGSTGLPPPTDYRDMPFSWRAGDYPMDQDALRKRLQRAQLVIGPVRQTCQDFFARYDPAPIGCIFWDLDYYSSTIDAFQILEGPDQYFLPRVPMYFDDILGFDMCDYTGERQAINDFNQRAEYRKISPEYDARVQQFPQSWKFQIFVYHNFAHREYCKWIWEQMPSHQAPATADLAP